MGNVMDNYSEVHGRRMKFLLGLVKEYHKEGGRIGDIGISPFSCICSSEFGSNSFYSIIPDESFKKKEIECFDQLNFFIGDITRKEQVLNKEGRISNSEGFDIIVFSEVLEHLFSDDLTVLVNIRTLLKDDGILLLTVPNISSLWNRIRLLFGKNVLGSKHEIINGVYGGYGHIREYTFKETLQLLSESGYKVVRKLGFNGYGPRNGIGKILNALLKIFPMSFSFHIVCVATRGDLS